MDIFLLHSGYREAARSLCDKDLTSALRALDLTLKEAHARVHDPRPFPAWVQESLENYAWTSAFFVGCCDEYGYRFEHMPSCFGNAKNFTVTIPTHLPAVPQTPFPTVGAIDRITHDRLYYFRYRNRSVWTKRERPAFFFRMYTTKTKNFRKHGTFNF